MARDTIGGIVDGVNAFEGDDADFTVEIRIRKLPALVMPEPELDAIENESPKPRKK